MNSENPNPPTSRARKPSKDSEVSYAIIEHQRTTPLRNRSTRWLKASLRWLPPRRARCCRPPSSLPTVSAGTSAAPAALTGSQVVLPGFFCDKIMVEPFPVISDQDQRFCTTAGAQATHLVVTGPILTAMVNLCNDFCNQHERF